MDFLKQLFQHTAARRRLERNRPKRRRGRRFNTQPPEGGWNRCPITVTKSARFNTQPPEGGWLSIGELPPTLPYVSTHSRPKAAGVLTVTDPSGLTLFQHTAARRRLARAPPIRQGQAGFNTQPPEGGWQPSDAFTSPSPVFQHTAARRRLGVQEQNRLQVADVSTHSRPKAAG